jgi:hypothetical protein
MNFPAEHPFFYYAALSASMSGCLYLFYSVKRDLAETGSGLDRRIGALETTVNRHGAHAASLESRLGEWAARTAATEEKLDLLQPARRPGPAPIDASSRSQVLRLARLGQRPERIAAELSLPRNEVDLMLKVHRAVIRTF